MGEIKQRDDGKAYFQRGVTDYPAIGDPAALITRDELRLIYDISERATRSTSATCSRTPRSAPTSTSTTC